MKFMPMGPYPVEVSLCLSRADWNRYVRSYCEAEAQVAWDTKQDACLQTFDMDHGAPRMVVCFTSTFRQHGLWERVGIVAHEAAHIWQVIQRHIGVTVRDDEIESCTVQWIVEWLCRELAAAGWMEA